jgi:hypothetical protein
MTTQVCITDDRIFLVTEFCPNRLEAYVKSPVFTTPEFYRVALELFDVLVFLHRRNVAHRDLKPVSESERSSRLAMEVVAVLLVRGWWLAWNRCFPPGFGVPSTTKRLRSPTADVSISCLHGRGDDDPDVGLRLCQPRRPTSC